MDFNERESDPDGGNGAATRARNDAFWKKCLRFSVRSVLIGMLLVAAFLAGRQSRELYPSLWFLGRVEPAIPPKTAYVETGSTLYVATNLKIPRLAVHNRAICEAQPDTTNQFRLLGKKAGTTTVLYWLEGREEPVELSVVVAPRP